MASPISSSLNPKDPKLKRHFGTEIERKAWNWLSALAPEKTLLASNFFFRGGEIDLIWCEGMSDRKSGDLELVFCEVRARRPSESGDVWVSGIESVTQVKRLRIERGVTVYLNRLPERQKSLYSGIRIDVVEWDGRAFQHWKSAW